MVASDSDDLRYSAKEQNTAKALFAEHYNVLLAIARQRRRRHGVGETLQTTALVHEAFLRLENGQSFRSENHFLGATALAMRHVIIDYARRKIAQKRGGSVQPLGSDAIEDLPEFRDDLGMIVEIGDLMGKLGDVNERWPRIVDARYFAGMTEEETASMLDLSARTVRRDWKDVRSWLKARLMPAD